MTTYAVTTANWKDPAFWSAISEGAGGHALDFSALPSNFDIDVDKAMDAIARPDDAVAERRGKPDHSRALDTRPRPSTTKTRMRHPLGVFPVFVVGATACAPGRRGMRP